MDSVRALLPAKDGTAASRLLILVGIVVVIAGLYFGRRVLIPLALAMVLAFLLAPIVGSVEKCRLGRVPSVLVVMALSFALLAAAGWALTNQLMEILVHLPDYKTNIHSKIEALRAPGNVGLSKATATVDDLSKELSAASETAANKKLNQKGAREPIAVQVAAPPRSATEYLRDVAGPLAGILETAGIVVIFTLFVLIKREDLRNRLFRLAGSGQCIMRERPVFGMRGRGGSSRKISERMALYLEGKSPLDANDLSPKEATE